MKANLECDASGFMRLCDVSRLLDTMLPATMDSIGSTACDIAQSMAPVYSPGNKADGSPRKGHTGGTLRQSISYRAGHEGNTYWAQIGTNIEYAPYVEFGTGRRGSDMYVASDGSTVVTEGLTFKGDWPGMGPNPYIRPALYDFKDLYLKKIEHAVMRSMRKEWSS